MFITSKSILRPILPEKPTLVDLGIKNEMKKKKKNVASNASGEEKKVSLDLARFHKPQNRRIRSSRRRNEI